MSHMHHSFAKIDECIESLNQGDLVALPTETVYGLAADARNESAVEKVFRLKGRPLNKPLIVHIPKASALSQWATTIPDYAWTWVKMFWPGPLTMVFPRRPEVSTIITAGQDTVALRVPNHPQTLELLERWGGAFVAPSANRYGHISPTSASDVLDEFGEDAPTILDGGSCAVGIESTIVSCLDDSPRILRLGMISAQALSMAADLPVASPNERSSVVTPGQSTSHYAPQTLAVLMSREAINQAPLTQIDCGFIGFEPPPMPLSDVILLPRSPEAAAQCIYSALRRLDQAGRELIIIETMPTDSAWSPIADRLTRATAQNLEQHRTVDGTGGSLKSFLGYLKERENSQSTIANHMNQFGWSK